MPNHCILDPRQSLVSSVFYFPSIAMCTYRPSIRASLFTAPPSIHPSLTQRRDQSSQEPMARQPSCLENSLTLASVALIRHLREIYGVIQWDDLRWLRLDRLVAWLGRSQHSTSSTKKNPPVNHPNLLS